MAVRAKKPGSPKVGSKSIHKSTRLRKPTPKAVRKPMPRQHIRSARKVKHVQARTAIRTRRPSTAKLPSVGKKGLSKEYLRQKAVKQAWKQESRLVRQTGRGTRRWTPRQIDLLKKGRRVPGYEGHHMRDVSTHSKKWAGDPRNIKLVTRRQHLREHKNSFRNPSTGKLIDRQKILRNRLQRRTLRKRN